MDNIKKHLDELEKSNQEAKYIYETAELIGFNLQIQAAKMNGNSRVFNLLAKEVKKLAQQAKNKGEQMGKSIEDIRNIIEQREKTD